MILRIVIVLLLALAARAAFADDGEIYTYKRGGERLFTDKKQPRNGWVYIGTYGRPTAFVSCRNFAADYLKTRADAYGPLIEKHAKKFGVPGELIKAVMHVESCFDRNAVSRVGARGLMQLMPDTAALLGVSDSFNAGQNIEGGARYLSMMHERYPGDWNLALAAYNAGPNAVDKYGAVPPFKETRHYVERVLGLYAKALKSQPPAPAAEFKTSVIVP